LLKTASKNNQAADAIAPVLSCSTKLKYLDMHNCNLQKGVIINIARAVLQSVSTLEILDVSKYNISVVKQQMTTFLKYNTRSSSLSMLNNNLQIEGVIKIAKVLQNTPRLFEIGPEAAEHLANAVLQKAMLACLDL